MRYDASRPRTDSPEASLSAHQASRLLAGVRFARLDSGAAVAEGAVVGTDAFLANGVTLYPGVRIGDGCTILDGTVIGRIPISNGTTTRPIESAFQTVEIGAGSIVGANAVIYTGTTFGERTLIGDLASIREGCKIGDRAILGRG